MNRSQQYQCVIPIDTMFRSKSDQKLFEYNKIREKCHTHCDKVWRINSSCMVWYTRFGKILYKWWLYTIEGCTKIWIEANNINVLYQSTLCLDPNPIKNFSNIIKSERSVTHIVIRFGESIQAAWYDIPDLVKFCINDDYYLYTELKFLQNIYHNRTILEFEFIQIYYQL